MDYRDAYGGADSLRGDWRADRTRRATTRTAAELGLVVEDVTTGWCGAVVAVEKAGGMQVVHLEDRAGRVKAFPLGPGFLVDGAPVELTAPKTLDAAKLAQVRAAASRTASGSRAVASAPAKVASGSRIFVEGRHDAELVEHVWGADLRVEGVVVELLDGVDDLVAAAAAFKPGPTRRMGVLVDHLVPGSKESRIVDAVRADPRFRDDVLVLGHPYIDIWQAVRPARVGLKEWPTIPRGVPWKEGVLAHLGLPHESLGDIAAGWHAILRTVRSYADLEPALLASVEELIDFVTAPSAV